MTDIRTMNLSDGSEGMVQLNSSASTSFVQQQEPEKNISENKVTMDSTPIAELMGHPESMESQMMMAPPQMQMPMQQMPMQAQMAMAPAPAPAQQASVAPESKNPFNLTDQQMQALLVAACTAAAISTPVQEKLATMIPQFLNDTGRRSLIGLAATGLVASVIFHIGQTYAIKA
jgi:hypothetical protein